MTAASASLTTAYNASPENIPDSPLQKPAYSNGYNSSLSLPALKTYQHIMRLFTPCLILLCIITICLACGGKKEPPKKEGDQKVIVDVIIATPVQISDTIEANGTAIANESVELHPEVTGRLTYLNVPEGAHVSKGTVLARVNDADLTAQLVKSRAQLVLAQENEQRLKKLLDIQGVNQADYDAVVNQVTSLQADINYSLALIDKTVIRAPFDGVIGLRQVSPGAYVSPSNIIATLQQVSRIKIDFTMPEEYSNILKKGNLVLVESDQSGQKYNATIIATEPQVNQSTRNIKVRALLDEATGNPGAFVKVYVQTNTDKKGIMVPTNSLIPNDKTNQAILVKKGKAVFTDVQTGLRNADDVEITSGINAGDTVIVTGVLFAKPGADVKVRGVKNLQRLDNVADSTN